MMNKGICIMSILLLMMVASGQTVVGEENNRMNSQSNVRHAAMAGTWYTANPNQLRESIDIMLEQTRIERGIGSILGLVVPHAGYVYSGRIAARAYKQVAGRTIDTVVLISPNHVDPRLRFSSVMVAGAYETPLGRIPIDDDVARAIVDYDGEDNIRQSAYGHTEGYGGRDEHSIEIQLPFLQVALGSFKLVPIVMGEQSPAACDILGRAIASAVSGTNVLIVASSDMSHFYDAETAREYDAKAGEYIASYDPEGLVTDPAIEQAKVCGAGPIAAMMIACRHLGAANAKILEKANSGDVTGDNDSVVGYLSAIISRDDTDESGDAESVGVDIGLTDQEKTVLRNVVQNTLERVVNGGPLPEYNNTTGNLGKEMGAFVTLNKNGRLRGCIGHIIGEKPLINTVAEMTRAAALEDPRFSRVTPEELADIEFEISVLTPLREIRNINEIVIGRDGLIISRGLNRGVLLPQVASDYGWDRETFLEQTCQKAGLPRNAWKEKGTTIELFSAEVFK